MSLLAFIDDDFEEPIIGELEALARELMAARTSWVIRPPQIVDEVDELGDRTVGIVHYVYAPVDDAGKPLDERTDSQLLEEVHALVDGLERVSAACQVDFGLELDDHSVGWVERGKRTQSLQRGLLDSWVSEIRSAKRDGDADASG